MKLTKKIKTKWIAALRSGKYKQVTGTLYDPKTKGFCCLGVLEHICMDGNVETVLYHNGVRAYMGVPSREFYNAYDVVMSPGDVSVLTNMNDGLRLDFKGIAKWIEKHVETK